MGSNTKPVLSNTSLKGTPLKRLLMIELNKAKIRLYQTPYPFCELDCEWLPFCRHANPPSCILSELTDPGLWKPNGIKSLEI